MACSMPHWKEQSGSSFKATEADIALWAADAFPLITTVRKIRPARQVVVGMTNS
jgi:hypothetical protein